LEGVDMTTLPIDYRKRPWKTKYLDEETPVLNRWIIFGTYPDGSVGINDGQEDILEWVPEPIAQDIVAARNLFVEKVLQHFGRI
jgi:hypothetical protein